MLQPGSQKQAFRLVFSALSGTSAAQGLACREGVDFTTVLMLSSNDCVEM